MKTPLKDCQTEAMFNNGWRSPPKAMSAWLDRIGAGLVLQHPEMLGYDYLPSELIGRDQQLIELASMFAGLEKPNSSGRAVITGPVGSGKTALSRRFVEDISRHHAEKRNIRWLHINCRNNPSPTQVMQRVIQYLSPGHPDRGLGVGEILASVRRLLKQSSSHIIIILDEADHLLRKSGDDLVYRLLRIDEDQDSTGSLSLILISQEQILDLFEGAVISRFGRSRHLRMQGYDEEGLFGIAKQRVSLAFTPSSIDESVILLIAEAATASGDARVVIDLLDAAAKSAELDGRSEVLSSDVQISSRVKEGNHVEIIVDELATHAMILLTAVCRRLKSCTEITSGDVETLYRVVCEEFEQAPRGHTTLWKYLKQFEECDLLVARIDRLNEGRGRTQHFSMPHMLPADLEKHLQPLINKRLRT